MATGLSVCVRCQSLMSVPPEARHELSSRLAVVAFFLVTAVSIACEFWYIYPIPYSSTTTGRFVAGGAALASPVAFLCACVLVFFRPRAAYGLGLAAGLMGLPWFILAERSSPISSWIIFNVAFAPSSGAEVFVILSAALMVVSSGCALLRLLPARWTLRKMPVGQRNWPAIATGFLVLGIWLYHAGTPYQIPVIADEITPKFRILHVEKRGLRFHETAIRAYRNGVVLMSRSERNLLHYKFETQGSRGVMPHEQVEAFSKSIELLTLRPRCSNAAFLECGRLVCGWRVEDPGVHEREQDDTAPFGRRHVFRNRETADSRDRDCEWPRRMPWILLWANGSSWIRIRKQFRSVPFPNAVALPIHLAV